MADIVFVTGSTGTTGKEVVRGLVESGLSVRAGIYSEANADKARELGAEVVRMDLGDISSIEAALKGVDKAFSLSPVVPNIGELGANFVTAAKRSGVKHIVRLSAMGADAPDPITLGRQHREAENALEESGIPYTIVRPNVFMQNYFNFTGGTIKDQGAFYFPQGEGKISMVDVRDVADVIVASLTESGHEGKTYDVTGPEAISNYQVADILSGATGSKISYVDVPEDAARQAMADSGMPQAIVAAILEVAGVIKAGYASTVTGSVAQVIGRPPTSFEKFAADHKAHFA